jgi:putative tryptophan/tyrosine transport system substrate-binding protein
MVDGIPWPSPYLLFGKVHLTSGFRWEHRMRLTTLGLLIMALTYGLIAVGVTANAQQPGNIPRIVYLDGRSAADASHFFDVFRQGLRELGYVEGQHLVVEASYAEGKHERLAALAAELVRSQVSVIVTAGLVATRAAQQATTTIPIVQAQGGDLVLAGLVASLARPGGNITGLSIQDVEGGGKRLELLKAAVPHASRIAVLWNAAQPAKVIEWQQVQEAGRVLGVTLSSVEVRGAHDFARAFATLTAARPDALFTLSDNLTVRHRQQIVDFATTQRLPMRSEVKEFAEAGGLMTYGGSLTAMNRRAATYVDKILKGAKPADLPVEQPMKFELVINLKTAKALGLTIPPMLLYQADEVIQ